MSARLMGDAGAMGYPRKLLISLSDTPYYHVIGRCVRRAWLCGYDTYAGKDYSHRKYWVMQRLRFLAEIFAIDLCAYAIMSNHYHLVVRVDREQGARLSNEEVVLRWTRLFRAPPLIRSWLDGDATTAERAIAEQLIERWRKRLIDISWYMRTLNEYLARRANAEDECTGRFWEGRFKSQALLDEAGLLTAMAYVDLNPVRAGIATTPEESVFTSIYARIRQHALQPQVRPNAPRSSQRRAWSYAPPLLPFRDQAPARRPSLPMRFKTYLQLVDYTGRIARADKAGIIDAKLAAILERLRIDPEAWTAAMCLGGNRFGRALGRLERLRSHAQRLGQAWIRGLRAAQRLYGRA
jgi:REP element-mobilizing transposase RayT